MLTKEQRAMATDEQIREWADRYDLPGSLSELRCMFEDAQTLLATQAAVVRVVRDDYFRDIDEIARAASDKLDRAGFYDEATLIIQLLQLTAPSPPALDSLAQPYADPWVPSFTGISTEAPALGDGKDCPHCPNQGWYSYWNPDTGYEEQVQCEWCDTTPDSKFNLTPPAPEGE